MNTSDGVPERAQDFAAESNTANTVDLASYDGLDQFHSESGASVELIHAQPVPRRPLFEKETADASPVPNAPRASHVGLPLVTSAVAVVLAVVIAGPLLETRSAGKRTVRVPAETFTEQVLSNANSPSPPPKAAVPPTGSAVSGVVRHAPDTPAPRAVVKPTPGVPRLPSDVSSATRRRRELPRAAVTPPTRVAQLPSRSVSGPATAPPRAAAPAPAVVEADTPAGNERPIPASTREPAAPQMGALVSVNTSNSNSDELTFRWGAPVGTFADATARETRFFCPETPQSVAVTVTVTDGNGAAASDTITVQCVAATR